MKRVSYNVAKSLKEAGYPQDIKEVYKENGEYFTSYIKYSNTFAAPTYLEVWLWLWREKKINLLNVGNINNEAQIDILQNGVFIHTTNAYSDPEEAIIAAIEYLVDEELIK